MLLSVPRGNEMFQFPRFPLPALCVQAGVTPLRAPGFPIRISTDQSLVGSSPWLFAATHVLHRCQVPRHPPLAFCSLEEQRCSCSLCSSQGARRRDTGQLHSGARRRGDGDRSLKTEERTVTRTSSTREEETPTTLEHFQSETSECSTFGSRPYGCRDNDSLERR